jgi:hypothetical protein
MKHLYLAQFLLAVVFLGLVWWSSVVWTPARRQMMAAALIYLAFSIACMVLEH